MTRTRLAGKVALVTGGASGIGRACVLAYLAEGALVAAVDRNQVGLEQVVKEAEAKHGVIVPFRVDLADVAALEPLVASVVAAFDGVDILVNSAGIDGGGITAKTVLDLDPDEMDLVYAVNQRAPAFLTKFVGRQMVAQGRGGKMVNLSSSSGFRGRMTPAAYAATKAAVAQLTRTAAADLGPYEINVNAIAPGLTRTPMVGAMGDEGIGRHMEDGPLSNFLGRVSEPEDVANVAVFLSLPESRQITGQTIHVSAGAIV